MTSKSTWLLLVCAAAAFAVILFVERPFREQKNRRPDSRVFPGLDAARVSSIQLRPANQFDIRAEKTNDTWQLVKPVRATADASKINDLLQTLAKLTWLEHITSEELRNRPKAQEEFGLSTPQFAITFEEGAASHTLLIGSKSVVGTEMFAQVVGGDGFFVLDGAFLANLPVNANEWRDAAALPQSVLTANVVEVQAGAKSFRLELDPTNALWRMTRPLEARGNDIKIRELIAKLAAARSTAFVSDDPNADFEKFGLPNTSAQTPELAISFFEGTNLLTKLEAGVVSTNATGQVFARRAGQSLIFLLPKEVIDPWRGTPSDFWDRRLIQFPAEKIELIDMRGEDSFSLQRESTNRWLVKAGAKTFPADAESAQDLLTVLNAFEVTFENDVVTDFAQFGLTNPAIECAIHGVLTNALSHTEEKLVEKLQFGFGTNDAKVFIHRNNEVRVYSISRRDFELLPRASWQLRDRRIWEFAPTNVISVTIRQHGQTRKIIRNGENEWSVAPGSQGIIDPFSLEEAVHRLGTLKALFWTARGDQNRQKFGFKDADHQIDIEIKRDGGTQTLSLEFGGFSEFRHPYGLTDVSGEKMVFEFPLPLYLEFVRRDLCILPPPLPFK